MKLAAMVVKAVTCNPTSLVVNLNIRISLTGANGAFVDDEAGGRGIGCGVVLAVHGCFTISKENLRYLRFGTDDLYKVIK